MTGEKHRRCQQRGGVCGAFFPAGLLPRQAESANGRGSFKARPSPSLAGSSKPASFSALGRACKRLFLFALNGDILGELLERHGVSWRTLEAGPLGWAAGGGRAQGGGWGGWAAGRRECGHCS